MPRDVASRAIKVEVDKGRGVGPLKNGAYLDFSDRWPGSARTRSRERYDNLFQMYERITGEDPYRLPMRIYPAVHYVMGGLWVDYELQSTIPGCFVAGEANFSDHGANRLGASALMQGLSDGYFVLPYTVPNYLAACSAKRPCPPTTPCSLRPKPRCASAPTSFMSTKGTRSVDHFHRELGKIMWDNCGMERSQQSLEKRCRDPRAARRSSRKTCASSVPKTRSTSRSRRPAASPTFFELAALMCRDALHREESCGGHFRVEHQTEEGEARRNDDDFAYAAAWEYAPPGSEPVLHKEPLDFEYVHLAQRSYK